MFHKDIVSKDNMIGVHTNIPIIFPCIQRVEIYSSWTHETCLSHGMYTEHIRILTLRFAYFTAQIRRESENTGLICLLYFLSKSIATPPGTRPGNTFWEWSTPATAWYMNCSDTSPRLPELLSSSQVSCTQIISGSISSIKSHKKSLFYLLKPSQL